MKSKTIKILSKKVLIGMVVISLVMPWIPFDGKESQAAITPEGKIIYVDADNNSGAEDGSEEHPYNTIQKAVDDANSGDTIFVDDGIYNENIDVNKDYLTILSRNGPNATIVQASTSNDNVFEIKANYVTISGFTVEGAYQSSAGILLDNANYCQISNNIALNNDYGIYLRSSNKNTLTGNTMSNNRFNFFLWGNSDEHFDNDIDTTNTVDGKPIYYIQNVVNQVYDNSTNAGTFYCIACDNVTVKDLTVAKNGSGIFFWKTENSRIENITASNNMDGIHLRFSNNNTLISNNVLDDMSGIGLYRSNNNILTNNVTLNVNFGIGLAHSDNNILNNNTTSDNEDGMFLCYSENNRIYHNNFINNNYQMHLMSSTDNFFDNGYPSGGNYWSDYNEEDLYRGPNQDQDGKDGIGDVPYAIEDIYTSEKVYDRYPLMKESGWEVPVPICGNGLCEQGETFENCCQDCSKKGIEKYFPYWKFSQGEKYYPTSFYFDNDADVENNRENYEAKKGDWIKPYVYAHTVEDENYFTIQYWMYEVFNYHRSIFIPEHDHDWDATIFVVFDKDDFSRPIEVRFARHIYIGVYPWNEIEKNDETHPVAYVAQGSHGAYRSEDMGSLDVFESGGLIYNPNFFNWYKVGNCIEEIKKEINGEQREFCKVENELLKGEEQNEPADGYWPKDFTGHYIFNSVFENAPWHSDNDRWFQTRPKGLNSALEFGVDCPVDLHIYDPEGKHIGINYETNEPEIEIPEAIFLQRDDKQYILIPNPIKGDYQVEIIGKDDGEYDFTMIASEDMKLIEKEEKKNVPIAKEETQSFVIPSLWENPREIKQKAIDDLKLIETDNKYHQRNIKQAIKFINKSLNQSFWNDELHLDKKQGMMVFRNELRAMMYLKSFNSFRWRGQKTKSGFDNSQVSSSIKKAIDRLTKADEILDEVVIDEAKNTPVKNNRFKKKVKQLINKAEKELKKAKQNSKDNKPVRAIIHSQNAWRYSQIAIRLAEIEDFDYFKKTKKHKNK